MNTKEQKDSPTAFIITTIIGVLAIVVPYVQNYMQAQDQAKSQEQLIKILEQQNESRQKDNILSNIQFMQQQLLPKCVPDRERNQIGNILTNASILAILKDNLTGANHLINGVKQRLINCISVPSVPPAVPIYSVPGVVLVVVGVAGLIFHRMGIPIPIRNWFKSRR